MDLSKMKKKKNSNMTLVPFDDLKYLDVWIHLSLLNFKLLKEVLGLKSIAIWLKEKEEVSFGRFDTESSRPDSMLGRNDDCSSAKTRTKIYINNRKPLVGVKPRPVNTPSSVISWTEILLS